jgi:hypothetical protein
MERVMSVLHTVRHRWILLAGLLSVAGIAACDNTPVAPRPAVITQHVQAGILGDTSGCRNGWVVINGRYQCN